MYKVAHPGILVSLLNDGIKPIILLGAGASKQSGIKLVTEIVEEAAKWAYCRDNGLDINDPRLTMSDWKTWLTKFPWYVDDYSTLYPKVVEELLNPRQARKDFFLRIINPDVKASKGYEILAQLLHLHLLDTILTANFDNCLGTAKVQVRKPPVITEIKTPFDLQTTFSYSPRYPQLIYLHGSVEHYTDQNLIEEVQNLNVQLVNYLKPLMKDRPLVVIGYRGAEPSIMQDLFINNLAYTNNFHQGIYWCILKREHQNFISGKDNPTKYFKQLVEQSKTNFHVIPIDGFDELMTTEIWGKLEANEIDLRHTSIVKLSGNNFTPSFDTKLISQNTIGPLEIALLRERVKNYCQRLRIKIYEDEDWLYQQMVLLRIAETTIEGKYELTSSGILLFSSRTQEFISNATTILKFIGDPLWIRQITSFASEKDIDSDYVSTGVLERKILGNLWSQLNEITDALTLVNRPYRLKGEISESVYPYPTLALKEVIVNSLVHRDYSINESVNIEIRQTEILFRSPGGLVEEVKRQLASSTIEEEIKKGKRGIKGYRNPVLADLFYGSGAMDKEGSGLSDVMKQITENSSFVNLGPTVDNSYFEVKIFRRYEEVNSETQTATPLILNQTTRFASNTLEVLQLPEKIYFGDTDARKKRDVFKQLGDIWLPPYSLKDEKIWSFYDLSEHKNPLHKCVDLGTVESMSIEEFVELKGGTNDLVFLLNESLLQHLFSIGLRVDPAKKRAYFTSTYEGEAKEISYQGRLKKATRTVAKPRVNPTTEKIYYWEHKSIWYNFELIGNTWYLILNPAYVFTIDGVKSLLRSERVNILSTKKASRDYNMSVHNDLTFWANYLSQNNEEAFFLHPNSKEINDGRIIGPIIPHIILSAKLPTIVINDISVSEEYFEPIGLVNIEDIDRELEELAIQQKNTNPDVDNN